LIKNLIKDKEYKRPIYRLTINPISIYEDNSKKKFKIKKEKNLLESKLGIQNKIIIRIRNLIHNRAIDR